MFKYRLSVSLLMSCLAATGCMEAEGEEVSGPESEEARGDFILGASPASIGLVGNPGDVSTVTDGGTVLMGGGTDVDDAIRWMIQQSHGGDFVVIRATGSTGYNDYIYSELGGVDSVETLLINSRELANNPLVEETLLNAEAVFIAGGDQANYVNFWKDTLVEDTLNYLRNVKTIPIGGTSAGCAIQGEAYFDALNGTIRSDDALRNPYDALVTIGYADFLDNPYLEDTITDTHYNNPDRRGRHMTFMARLSEDRGLLAKGIGVDEQTAVAIDADGYARVFGSGDAFFLQQVDLGPEICEPGQALDWYRNRRAVEVYRVRGSASGSGGFDLYDWSGGSGGRWEYFSVDNGRLRVSR